MLEPTIFFVILNPYESSLKVHGPSWSMNIQMIVHFWIMPSSDAIFQIDTTPTINLIHMKTEKNKVYIGFKYDAVPAF